MTRQTTSLLDYQAEANKYCCKDALKDYMLLALGLSGEAGEVSEKIKKIHWHQNGVFGGQDKEEVAKELGDVLWYLSQIGRLIGYNLEDIAAMNIRKLSSRENRGILKGYGDNR